MTGVALCDTSLPAGFAELERFVPDWCLPDAAHRLAKRLASSIAAIREFYEAMLPRGEEALAVLRHHPMGAIPPGAERLLKLMLSLAEVAPAVEWYNDPRVFDGFPVERLRYVRQISDTAYQPLPEAKP